MLETPKIVDYILRTISVLEILFFKIPVESSDRARVLAASASLLDLTMIKPEALAEFTADTQAIGQVKALLKHKQNIVVGRKYVPNKAKALTLDPLIDTLISRITKLALNEANDVSLTVKNIESSLDYLEKAMSASPNNS